MRYPTESQGSIFPTPIWHKRVEEEELPKIEELRQWALRLEKTDKGEVRSNRKNTFHSVATRDFSTLPHFDLLKKKLEFLPSFDFDGWWINVQRKGDYNIAHTHPNSDIAFIWYLTDNYKSLVFNQSSYEMTRTRLYQAYKKMNHLDEFNPFLLNWRWKCNPGDLLVFPADLLHWTEPHTKRQPRICISGNLTMNNY